MDLDDPDTRMDDDDENEYENHPSENSTRKHYDEAEEVDEEEDEVEHKTRRKKKVSKLFGVKIKGLIRNVRNERAGASFQAPIISI